MSYTFFASLEFSVEFQSLHALRGDSGVLPALKRDLLLADVIRAVKPDIVLVEVAAEVLEPQILAILGP